VILLWFWCCVVPVLVIVVGCVWLTLGRWVVGWVFG